MKFFVRKKRIILLNLFGCIQGGFLGHILIHSPNEVLVNLATKLWSVFSNFKFITDLPYSTILGIAIALFIQFYCRIVLGILTSYNRKLYDSTTWLLAGISSGVLASLAVIGGNTMAIGFILPYLIVLVVPAIPVLIFGFDTINLLAVDAIQLTVYMLMSFLLNFLSSLLF